jgi:hypothetical protein
MKIKILILSILSMITIRSFANAWEILLQPSHWQYSPWCMLWIDIVMDPEWAQISATDIVIESSMQFIKFEPTSLFPYFLPTKITDNITHIVGFTSWPSQRVSQKWVVWKIFFKPQNKSDADWSIKFYIKAKWDTTDTNLSIWWWVDVLEDTRNWFYTFNWTNCDYPDEEIIPQESNVNFEESLNDTVDKIEKEHMADVYQKSREDNKSYIISLFIIIVILVAYFKIFKWKSKKK